MVFFIFNFFFNTRQIQQKLRLHNFQLQYLVARAFHTKISYQRNRLFFFLTNTRVTTHTHTHTPEAFSSSILWGTGAIFPMEVLRFVTNTDITAYYLCGIIQAGGYNVI